MNRNLALLVRKDGRLALLTLTVRPSASPARLKCGLITKGEHEGRLVTVAVTPEWRMELN